MSEHEVKGRDRERDEAERWLAENDPDYAQQKRNWQTPSTDALARDRATHKTLKELTPTGSGTYRKLSKRNPDDVSEDSEF